MINGYVEDERMINEFKELNKKDGNAIFVLNQLVTSEIYHRIYNGQTTME